MKKANETDWGFFVSIECGVGFSGLEGLGEPRHPKNKRHYGLYEPQGNMHTTHHHPASAHHADAG
jgi:hypothetical protein